MIKNNIVNYTVLLLFTLLLFGCSKEQPIDQAQPEPPASPPPLPIVEEIEANEPEPPQLEPELVLPAEILEMQQKISKITNYEYLDSETDHIVLVKDNRIVILTSDPNEYRKDDFKINSIFLNTETKVAFGVCDTHSDKVTTFNCGNNVGKYVKLDGFEEYLPDDPFRDLQDMKIAELKGSQQCERRQCDIIEYEKDGKNYRMFVRKIYFLPYKIAELDAEGFEVSAIILSDPAFDHLKEADVMIPDHYELVE